MIFEVVHDGTTQAIIEAEDREQAELKAAQYLGARHLDIFPITFDSNGVCLL